MVRKNSVFDFRRLPKPAKEFDVALLMQHESVGSNGKTHRHFETVAESKAEDRKRVTLLRRSAKKAAHHLADRLERALIENRLEPTFASHRYGRVFRRRLAGLSLAATDKRITYHTTLVNVSGTLTRAQLARLPQHMLATQFRKHLQRIGADKAGGHLSAWLHGDFDPKTKLFQLHWHIIHTEEHKPLWKKLTKRMGYRKSPTILVPRLAVLVKDSAVQHSYARQSFWHMKVRGAETAASWSDMARLRILGEDHTAYLLWLDAARISDLLISYPPVTSWKQGSIQPCARSMTVLSPTC